MDLSTAHPDPVQIFRLWDIYTANVNPLLKVTHTPTLQGRIIEAASNVKSIDPNLEALMFSIYSMAITSVDPDDSEAVFGSPKQILIKNYQLCMLASSAQRQVSAHKQPRLPDRLLSLPGKHPRSMLIL